MKAHTKVVRPAVFAVAFAVAMLAATPALALETPVFGDVSMTMDPGAPRDVAVADFNEDGFDDVASAMMSESGNGVAVSFGAAAPVLSSPALIDTGGAAWSVLAADFNGDGHMDIAASLVDRGAITVLLGHGDGTFDAAIECAASTPVRGLAAIDFNDDGRPEIVGAEPGMPGIAVLTCGDGGFTLAEQTVPGGQNLIEVAAGQLAGDALTDLAVVDNFAGRVLVLENRDGVFVQVAALATGAQPRAAVVADFNDDGVDDIVASSSIASDVEVFLGNGDGTFSAPLVVAAGEDVRTGALVAVDLEGDGDLDVLAANATTGELVALENDGAGHLSVKQVQAIGSGPTSIAMGNPDGNDYADIIVADYGDACVTVIASPQTPVFRPYALPVPVPNTLEALEVAGTDRYATAVEASKLGFPDGAADVVVASGENWPDAVTASARAGRLHAPLLLTRQAELPAVTAAEIARLGATHAVLIGGEAAVSSAVAERITTLVGAVTRLAGPTRYETADAVAAEVVRLAGDSYDGRAFIATGANFADALAVSPLANATGAPIYLTPPDGRSDLVARMFSGGVTDVVVLGGTRAVSAGVEDAVIAAFGAEKVTRVAGADRYATAAAVAEYGVTACGLGWDGVGLATGSNFPDALTGGTMLGGRGSVMLLSPRDALAAPAADVLRTHGADVNTIVFLGSTNALADAVRSAATSALR